MVGDFSYKKFWVLLYFYLIYFLFISKVCYIDYRQMLTAISYNIRYGRKIEKIINWFSAISKPYDIICLQEFPFDSMNPFLQIFPSKIFDYQYATGFTKRKKQYGELTIFNKKKIHVIDGRILDLGAGFFDDILFKTKGSRTSLITTFRHKNKNFILANTHLVCVALNKRRRNQITKLITTITDMPQSDTHPIIVLGDFNYSSLLRQKVLINLMNKYEFINAYKSPTHKVLFLKHQLDYVFYKNCFVEDVNVMKLKFSDHYPIQFTLHLQ